ncbi:hypothetical protein [Rhizobium leguminosarum]|uniref:hypothetical protein n=1 Tax=Rhizobium leguminosarum TaxID=384 RepID=UPI001441A951|nr:hypothetical protein [Rhizobium leguminosarum]NKL63314.1 hypothetical protein [Rhizobium leguminosarum bv. viciae]
MELDVEGLKANRIAERMFRTPPRIAVAVGMFILFTGYIAPVRSGVLDNQFGTLLLSTGLFIVVLGLTMDVYLYLRSTAPVRYLSFSRQSEDEVLQLRAEFEAVKAQAEEFASERGKVLLSPEDIAEVKKRTVEGLGKDALRDIASTIRAEVLDKAASDQATQIVSLVSKGIAASQRRLANEVESLGRRANVNLSIGFLVSLVGMIALAVFIWTATSELDGDVDVMQVVVRFLTKLSLVIFMQVFAYFFLRLYRYSLFEIKYFQNELTNIEQKYIALNVAMQSGNKDAVAKIAAELSKAERNFILKKGETTVGLQREEIEARYEAVVASKAEELLDKLGSLVRPAGRGEV